MSALSIVAHMTGGLPTVPIPRPLSERMHDVLHLASQGKSQAEIAAELGISVGTVKSHKFKIIDRIGRRAYRKAVYRNGE